MYDKFYGTSETPAFSYLEFGSIDMRKGKKHVWDFRLHQQAYDWLMHARYSNDLVTYMKLSEDVGHATAGEIVEGYKNGIHHQDDFMVNFGKLCALTVMAGGLERLSFFELGQTLFGCIEGMEFCCKVMASMQLNFHPPVLDQVLWLGADISEFFNRLAVLMHPRYQIKTSDTPHNFDLPADVFFAKGVTLLYAIEEPSQLWEMLNKGKISLFDYSFSLGGPQILTLGTGKRVAYLAYDDCKEELARSGRTLLVRRSRSNYDAAANRVFLDCVYGTEEYCNRYVELESGTIRKVAAQFEDHDYGEVLFKGSTRRMDSWIPLEAFVSEVRR